MIFWHFTARSLVPGLAMIPPTYVEWYINTNVAGNKSYASAAFGFGTQNYSGGGFSLIPALWNYAWRNIGKLVGAAILVPILPITISYALVRATYDYAEKAYAINKELALLPKAEDNIGKKPILANQTTSNLNELDREKVDKNHKTPDDPNKNILSGGLFYKTPQKKHDSHREKQPGDEKKQDWTQILPTIPESESVFDKKRLPPKEKRLQLPEDARAFAATSKSNYSLFNEGKAPGHRLPPMLLQSVARGEQDKAASILTSCPHLLSHRGDVTDYSGLCVANC